MGDKTQTRVSQSTPPAAAVPAHSAPLFWRETDLSPPDKLRSPIWQPGRVSGNSPGITVPTRITPPTASDAQLHAQGAVYRQGKTPVMEANGRLSSLDKAPADATLTGRQLGEVHSRFGTEGFERSVHALTITRGSDFVTAALNNSPASIAEQSLRFPARPAQDTAVHRAENARGSASPEGQEDISGNKKLASGLNAAGTGQPLPKNEQNLLETVSGHNFSKLRVVNNPASHQAAEQLGARAFTIGRSIYFGQNEYRPATSGGWKLLAHEAAHTVQQQNAAIPAVSRLTIGTPGSREEQEADAFAHAVSNNTTPQPLSTGSTRIARIMRALSFKRIWDSVIAKNPKKDEYPNGKYFEVAAYFKWDSKVEVTGAPGDPYDNWELGHLQIVRSFWKNVYWGTGKNRTHEQSWMPLPLRDSKAGMVWYDDASASTSPFHKSGDRRRADIEDSPGNAFAFANPLPPRTGTRGWFNWGDSFVTWCSVRDTTGPLTNASFRHLGHVYWNVMFSGSWNTRKAIGNRVKLDIAKTNKSSKIYNGQGSSHTPIITGPVANDSENSVLT